MSYRDREAMARALGWTLHTYPLGTSGYTDTEWRTPAGDVYDELPDFAALRQPGDDDVTWRARCATAAGEHLAAAPYTIGGMR